MKVTINNKEYTIQIKFSALFKFADAMKVESFKEISEVLSSTEIGEIQRVKNLALLTQCGIRGEDVPTLDDILDTVLSDPSLMSELMLEMQKAMKSPKSEGK